MDLAESAAYLRHRLKLGREGALFADDAIDAEFNTEPLGGPYSVESPALSPTPENWIWRGAAWNGPP